MKKVLFLLIIFLLSISCSSSFVGKRYIYIDTRKEQEIELYFFKDSTFVLKDINGCYRMGQKGSWSLSNSQDDKFYTSIIMSDDILIKKAKNMHGKNLYSYVNDLDNKQYIQRESNYFPPVILDTSYIIKNDRILKLRGLTFYQYDGDVAKKRLKLLEKEIISEIGKKMYIETIGEGLNIRKARENLIDCKR